MHERLHRPTLLAQTHPACMFCPVDEDFINWTCALVPCRWILPGGLPALSWWLLLPVWWSDAGHGRVFCWLLLSVKRYHHLTHTLWVWMSYRLLLFARWGVSDSVQLWSKAEADHRTMRIRSQTIIRLCARKKATSFFFFFCWNVLIRIFNKFITSKSLLHCCYCFCYFLK